MMATTYLNTSSVTPNTLSLFQRQEERKSYNPCFRESKTSCGRPCHLSWQRHLIIIVSAGRAHLTTSIPGLCEVNVPVTS